VGIASTAQKITVSGTGLTAQLLITPPTGFEVSTNWISEFGSRPIILNPVAGNISSTQIFVRISPFSVGAASGNLVISSAGSNTVNVALSGVGTNWSVPTSGGNYYSSTIGLSGSALKTALYNKILGHSSQSYTPGVWNAFATTDVYFNGKVWDIYSVNTSGTFPYEYTLGIKQCGNYSVEGDCYNREHTFPQSWFNSSTPMQSDLHHLYASDGKVNAMHNNFPYSEVAVVSSTSLIGCKLGTNAITGSGGYTGTVFEITDEYKGDIARSYFYMATRYENLIASWQNNGNANDVLAGNSFPVYDSWFINLLIKWHNLDPVSTKEINRNNAIFAIQNNRNPFVDSPQFVQKIWGGSSPNKPTVASSNVSVDLQSPSPVSFNIKWKSGNGNRRIVIVKAGAPVNAVPVDSIEYLARDRKSVV
jgi:endonuclease I